VAQARRQVAQFLQTWCSAVIESTKIRYKGFPIHNTLAAFKEIIDSFNWDMAQIQLNILDEHNPIGIEGLKYAAGKEIPVVIMEPLRGGSLLNSLSGTAEDLIAAYHEQRSFVEWCFRWLYNMPEVSVILSGTSSVEQLDDNLRIFDHSASCVMSEADMILIRQLQEEFAKMNSIGCTGCRYCMPCPQGVAIPELFELYNNYQITQPNQIDKVLYSQTFVSNNADAGHCISCGLCEKHCPQDLKIVGLLKTVHSELSMKS
jgi:predicted aldo/keto reductase-like oxidoreductase